MAHTVFLVEDTELTRRLFQLALESASYEVRTFANAESCLVALEATEPSAVCLDLFLPRMSGMEALPRIRQARPDVPVIIITSENDANVGVQAMKQGATDYLVKPVDLESLKETVRAAVQRFELILEIRRLRSEAAATPRLSGMVGRSPAMDRIAAQIGLILNNDVSVHISGETGTGKDLLARIIHSSSSRAPGPFVPVNCGAIPRELQESQFFGHEKGSFTGAVQRHRGYFEEAQSGTIFLDEVGEMAPAAQVKLLRALQEKEIRRVGGDKVIPIDTRVISATNRNLRAMVDSGAFREDLLYRLVVFTIELPPLRERQEDIPLLAGHFLRHYSEELNMPVPEVTDEALACLVAHEWPGNVRELQNAIQVTMLATQGRPVAPEHLPSSIPRTPRARATQGDGPMISMLDSHTGQSRTLEDMELEIFLRAREMAGGNISKAAQMLGIGRATMYRKLQGLHPVDASDAPGPEIELPRAPVSPGPSQGESAPGWMHFSPTDKPLS